jgi:hypothetical protein
MPGFLDHIRSARGTQRPVFPKVSPANPKSGIIAGGALRQWLWQSKLAIVRGETRGVANMWDKSYWLSRTEGRGGRGSRAREC